MTAGPGHRLQQAWYRSGSWLSASLLPLAWLFRLLAGLRRQHLQGRAVALPVPVVVVGNLSVGGTGKTPAILALAAALAAQGWRPGIISRGYGAGRRDFPARVPADGLAADYGDEPLLLAAAGWPVVIDPDRARAARYLLGSSDCNLILSDDGLQHYALARDVEIVVIDGQRGFGNGRCLPAGPLREPLPRLATVDHVLVNGGSGLSLPVADPVPMQLQPVRWRHLASGQALPLADWAEARQVHAVAGIGNPQRFFATLEQLGFTLIRHAFADHHAFSAADLQFGDRLPLIMTAKDAVKCQAFAPQQAWVLEVAAVLPDAFIARLQQQLQAIQNRKTA